MSLIRWCLLRRCLLLGLLSVCFVPSATQARRRSCHPAAHYERIAIVPLLHRGQRKPHRLHAPLVKLLSTFLTRSRQFRIVPTTIKRGDLLMEGHRIRPRNWKELDVRRLIKLRVAKRGKRVELYFFDRSKRQPTGKLRYERRSSLRNLAHRISEDLAIKKTRMRSYNRTRLAFVRQNGRASEVYVMDYDGHGLRRVSPRGQVSLLPSWSPRGELTFTSYLWKNPDLYIVRPRKKTRLSLFQASWTEYGRLLGAQRQTPSAHAEQRWQSRNLPVDPQRADQRPPHPQSRHRYITELFTRWSTYRIRLHQKRNAAALRDARPRWAPKQLTTVGSYNQEPAWVSRSQTPHRRLHPSHRRRRLLGHAGQYQVGLATPARARTKPRLVAGRQTSDVRQP
jgi:hypothetical protein